MADYSTLARPYAKAVFALAQEQKGYDDWSAILAGLAQAVSDPAVASMVGHPAIGRGQLGDALVAALAGKLTPEAGNLVRLLCESDRLKAAPAIASEYERLRAEAESRIDVAITSAAPVAAAQQEKLATAIRGRLNRAVAIAWSTDEALIAGAVIRAGDVVIDGSLRGELERLQTALAR